MQAFGQHAADSLYTYAQARQQTGFAFRSVTQLQASPVRQTGIAGIRAGYEAGSFRPTQESQQNRTFTFETAGIRTLGRFRVAGSFVLKRRQEDSLAWVQKGMAPESQPYYYASAKAGSYERASYHLNGLLAYTHGRLTVGSGLSYDYSHVTRSEDPRPEIDGYQLTIRPEIAYRWGRHLAGIGGSIGLGKEMVGMTFKNRNYQSSLAYPSRINYMVQGYGYLAIFQTDADFERHQNQYGFRLNYAGPVKGWDVKSEYVFGQWKDRNLRAIADSKDFRRLGEYRLNTHEWLFLAEKAKNGNSRQLSLRGLLENGGDINGVVNARSYTYTSGRLTASWLLLTQRQWEWGAGMEGRKVSKKDVLAGHYLEYAYLLPGVSVGRYYRNCTSGNRFSWQVRPSVRLPLTNRLNVPATQENAFTRGVVYPEYVYQTAGQFQAQARLEYVVHRFLKNYRAGFLLEGTRVRKGKDQAVPAGADFVPGDSRSSLYLTFQLFYDNEQPKPRPLRRGYFIPQYCLYDFPEGPSGGCRFSSDAVRAPVRAMAGA